jgi:SAM-dependent methyltransferase
VRSDLRGAGFHAGLIKANVQGLRRLIQRLHIPDSSSTWSHYADCCHYQEDDDAAKVAFVEQVTSRRRWGLVWDIGANTGRYSRIAAKSADYVLAIDGDGVAVDRMYAALKSEGSTNVLPILCNVAEPSPALGWRNRERGTLIDRGTPDLTLCLAVVHHLAIGVGIPLPEVVEWLGSLRSSLVVEFVTKDDPMVQRLLRNKEDAYDDYELPVFEQALEKGFRVTDRRVLTSGTRILYSADTR